MTLRDLFGKTAVVTGASSGIGAAVARALRAEGASVALAARSLAKLEALADELGPNAAPFAMDVADDASVKAGFVAIAERFGEIDVLVNNAGFGKFERVADADDRSFRDMMEVNYFGTVRCTRAVLPGFVARGAGSIVNVASVAGKFGTAKSAGYSATKHAVLGFTNALRQELHGTGVHVMAVNPGPVRTAFFEIADPEGGYVRNIQSMMVTAEDVARALVNGVKRGKAEVNVPRWMGLAADVHHVLPVPLINAFAAKFLKLK